MQFNKEKSINYILCAIGALFFVLFISKLSLYFWRFDFFNSFHYKAFFKFVVSGRILSSPKYIAFLMVLLGAGMMVYVAFSQILEADFQKILFKNKSSDEANSSIEEVSNKETLENAPVVEKEVVNTPVQNSIFDVYDKPKDNNLNPQIQNNSAVPSQAQFVQPRPQFVEQPLSQVETSNPNNQNSLIDEEKEREKLQAKIKEVMAKIQNKNETELENELHKDEKILTPLHADEPVVPEALPKLDMYFENISKEQNELVENTLVSAGFRLLSEIRIGKTGIDYLAVSKNSINLIQFDAKDGNWMANEDIEGDNEPQWFSEDDKKLSPVYRALDAKRIIEGLIDGAVHLPVNAYVCLADSNIMNFFDIQSKWQELGVDILKLNPDDNIDDIKALSEAFPPNSQEEVDVKIMDDLIAILEKAEIPE